MQTEKFRDIGLVWKLLLVMGSWRAVIYKAISFPDFMLSLVPYRKSKQTLALDTCIGFSLDLGELPTTCEARCIV